MTPAEAAEVFIRHALNELRSGRDPLPSLSAATAVLQIEEGQLPRDDISDLRDLFELAKEYAEDLEGLV